MQVVSVPVELAFGDRLIEGSARIPAGSMRPADLLPVLYGVGEAVIGFAAERAERDGRKISCRAGCGACCRQLVPISQAEAVYLAELIGAMPPEWQAEVKERFRQAAMRIPEAMLARLRDHTGADLAERRRLGEDYFRLGIACPFLEQESCSIYRDRPMVCRDYLVTSPPENCRTPSASTVAAVPLPVRPSALLCRFDDGIGNQAAQWVALPLLVDFGEQRKDRPQRMFDAPQMLRNFVAQIRAAAGSDTRG